MPSESHERATDERDAVAHAAPLGECRGEGTDEASDGWPEEGLVRGGVVVSERLACVGCGYQLKGLAAAGACSEWGSAVASSLRPSPVPREDVAARRRFATGARLVSWSLVCTVAVPACVVLMYGLGTVGALSAWVFDGLWLVWMGLGLIAVEHVLWAWGMEGMRRQVRAGAWRRPGLAVANAVAMAGLFVLPRAMGEWALLGVPPVVIGLRWWTIWEARQALQSVGRAYGADRFLGEAVRGMCSAGLWGTGLMAAGWSLCWLMLVGVVGVDGVLISTVVMHLVGYLVVIFAALIGIGRMRRLAAAVEPKRA